MVRESDLIALFDLDGTMADHTKALERDYIKIAAPGEKVPDAFEEGLPLYVKERIDLIRNQPGWWEKLERYEPGFDIYDLVVELGFNMEILSKGPLSADGAWSEKVKWVRRELGDNIDCFQSGRL